MERYKYEQLPMRTDGIANIRLLKLKPGKAEDEIHVSIHLYEFQEQNIGIGAEPPVTQWHALSYVWGDPEDVEDIIVDSPSGEGTGAQTLEVTKNLTEALRHLRHPDLISTMWIDAICIDQGTDETALQERTYQVKSMHHIYNRARNVIIWLGPEAQESSFALQLLADLGSSFSVDWATFDLRAPDGKLTEPMRSWRSYKHTSREHQAVCAFLKRSWFNRVWVRQEVHLANEGSICMVAGGCSLAWSDFRKAVHWLSLCGLDQRSPDAHNERVRISNATSICERHYSDENNLLNRVRSSQCRDARDKLYGCLGIMSLRGDSSLAKAVDVDYSEANTIANTYRNFFALHQKRNRTLQLLLEAGLRQGSTMRPTWVPDWRYELADFDVSRESAVSHFRLAECNYLEADVLEVHGCFGTRISRIRLLSEGSASQATTDWYDELSAIITGRPDSVMREVWVERVTRALCAPMANMRISPEQMDERRGEIHTYIQYLYGLTGEHERTGCIKAPQDLIPKGPAHTFESSIRYLKESGLPLIFSEDGFVGVGPYGARPGDQAFALLGCQALMLLRHHEGRHQVVGPCFIHDLNWGEALLGPLPGQYTVVSRYEPAEGACIPFYLNQMTGEATLWDPRVQWESLQAYPPMVNFEVVTEMPEEPMRVRPDLQYLQRHGVTVKTLHLI